jgi:hypothetical protein
MRLVVFVIVALTGCAALRQATNRNLLAGAAAIAVG